MATATSRTHAHEYVSGLDLPRRILSLMTGLPEDEFVIDGEAGTVTVDYKKLLKALSRRLPW